MVYQLSALPALWGAGGGRVQILAENIWLFTIAPGMFP